MLSVSIVFHVFHYAVGLRKNHLSTALHGNYQSVNPRSWFVDGCIPSSLLGSCMFAVLIRDNSLALLLSEAL